MTKAAAVEAAASNISVNSLAFAAIDIPDDMFWRFLNDQHLDPDQILSAFPMRRLGRPEELVAATRYLVSDDARYRRSPRAPLAAPAPPTPASSRRRAPRSGGARQSTIEPAATMVSACEFGEAGRLGIHSGHCVHQDPAVEEGTCLEAL